MVINWVKHHKTHATVVFMAPHRQMLHEPFTAVQCNYALSTLLISYTYIINYTTYRQQSNISVTSFLKAPFGELLFAKNVIFQVVLFMVRVTLRELVRSLRVEVSSKLVYSAMIFNLPP
jgi:hypothetical protein